MSALGGDSGTTGTQDLSKSGSLNLTPAAGGLTFAGIVNTVAANTSGTLAVNSQNTSGTNTLSGQFFLDSNLKITHYTVSGAGLLVLSGGRKMDLASTTPSSSSTCPPVARST